MATGVIRLTPKKHEAEAYTPMKRYIAAMILCLVYSTGVQTLWAMGNHSDVLRDQYGRALGGATVSVYNSGTPDLAEIFSDNGTVAIANPLTTDPVTGAYNFYAANGVYDLVFSHPQATFDPLRTQRISIIDGSNLSVNTNAQGLDANFDIDNVINSATTAKPLIVGDSVASWQMGRDPTVGLFFDCVVGGVPGACNYVRKLNAGYYWEIQNNVGSSLLRIDNNTGAATNLVLNTEATGNAITIQDETWWDVAGCQNTTATLVWNVPTANAPTAICDTGANTQKAYASFDPSTDQSFEMDWILPIGFTGGIDIKFRWKSTGTSGAAGWCAQLVRVPIGSTSDPAYPAQSTSNCVANTAMGTTLWENQGTITNVTCTNCQAGDHVFVRISRDANGSAVTDDLTSAGLLMKVGRVWRIVK